MPYECRVYLKHKHKTPYIYTQLGTYSGRSTCSSIGAVPGGEAGAGNLPSSLDVEAVVPMLDGLQQLGL